MSRHSTCTRMKSTTGALRHSNAPRRASTCTTAVHICYGYGIQANLDWKKSLGDDWRQYEHIFPALAKSSIKQVSLECANSHVPMELMGLLVNKDVLVGVIDVASDEVETPEQVADVIEQSAPIRAAATLDAVYELRHGADEPRDRTAQAERAGAGRSAGTNPARLDER